MCLLFYFSLCLFDHFLFLIECKWLSILFLPLFLLDWIFIPSFICTHELFPLGWISLLSGGIKINQSLNSFKICPSSHFCNFSLFCLFVFTCNLDGIRMCLSHFVCMSKYLGRQQQQQEVFTWPVWATLIHKQDYQAGEGAHEAGRCRAEKFHLSDHWLSWILKEWKNTLLLLID